MCVENAYLEKQERNRVTRSVRRNLTLHVCLSALYHLISPRKPSGRAVIRRGQQLAERDLHRAAGGFLWSLAVQGLHCVGCGSFCNSSHVEPRFIQWSSVDWYRHTRKSKRSQEAERHVFLSWPVYCLFRTYMKVYCRRESKSPEQFDYRSEVMVCPPTCEHETLSACKMGPDKVVHLLFRRRLKFMMFSLTLRPIVYASLNT